MLRRTQGNSTLLVNCKKKKNKKSVLTVSYTVKHSYTISLDIYLSEMKICIRPKTTMQMVTVALFVVTKPGNRSDVVLLVRNKQTVVPVEHQAGDGGYAHDMAIC